MRVGAGHGVLRSSWVRVYYSCPTRVGSKVVSTIKERGGSHPLDNVTRLTSVAPDRRPTKASASSRTVIIECYCGTVNTWAYSYLVRVKVSWVGAHFSWDPEFRYFSIDPAGRLPTRAYPPPVSIAMTNNFH